MSAGQGRSKGYKTEEGIWELNVWAEGGIFWGVHSRGNGRVRLLGIFQRNPKKEGGGIAFAREKTYGRGKI